MITKWLLNEKFSYHQYRHHNQVEEPVCESVPREKCGLVPREQCQEVNIVINIEVDTTMILNMIVIILINDHNHWPYCNTGHFTPS